MATPAPTGFVAPAIPWLDPQPLPEAVDLGPGCHAWLLQQGLVALSSQPEVQALVAFGSRGRGNGRVDSDLDLAGSRWHVMGDVAREGRVLYCAR